MWWPRFWFVPSNWTNQGDVAGGNGNLKTRTGERRYNCANLQSRRFDRGTSFNFWICFSTIKYPKDHRPWKVIPTNNLTWFFRISSVNPTHIFIFFQIYCSKQKKTNSVAFSPRANYTDWSTATCRRNLVSTFVDLWAKLRVFNFKAGGTTMLQSVM
jgi:hypothetical protein